MDKIIREKTTENLYSIFVIMNWEGNPNYIQKT